MRAVPLLTHFDAISHHTCDSTVLRVEFVEDRVERLSGRWRPATGWRMRQLGFIRFPRVEHFSLSVLQLIECATSASAESVDCVQDFLPRSLLGFLRHTARVLAFKDVPALEMILKVHL